MLRLLLLAGIGWSLQAEDVYQKALEQFQQGKYSELLQTLPREAKGAAPHNLRSLALLELRRYDDALDANRIARQLEPDNPNYLYNAGLIYTNMGESGEAERILRPAIQRFPASVRLRVGLGEAMLRLDRFRDAEQELRRAGELDPASVMAQLSLAKLFYALGDRENFAAAAAKAIKLDPRNSLACFYYGKYLIEMKSEPSEGAAMIRRSIELSPRFVEGLTAWAGLLVDQKRWDESIRTYQQALEVDPQNRQLYYLLAAAYRKSGQPEKAALTLAQYRERSHP